MAGKHVKREVIDFGDNRDVPSGPFALLDLFDGNTNVQVGFGVYDGHTIGVESDSFSHSGRMFMDNGELI